MMKTSLCVLFFLFLFDFSFSISTSKEENLNNLVHDFIKGKYEFDSWTHFLLKLKESLTLNAKPLDDGLADKLWYEMIPLYAQSSVPNSGDENWSGACFSSNNVSSTISSDQTKATITIQAEEPTSLGCEDFYLIATLQDAKFKTISDRGEHEIEWDLEKLTDAELFDIQTNGFRIFKFIGNMDRVMAALVATIELFIPEICCGPGVDPKLAQLNVDFLGAYADFDYVPREIQVVNLTENYISSGDFIGVTRMDGLDPMIIWGMGGTTGHTTVALWIGDQLNVCESTVNSTYWPTNGVQCTPFPQWIEQARAADYNFVHVPLSPSNRALFNSTSAYEFFKTVEGLPYGYHNFLFGWIDTGANNFPCIPPDYTECLSLEAVQVASGLMNGISPPIAKRMWIEAFNFRLGTKWNTTSEVYQYATQQGITFEELINMPEQDSWIYPDGKSMVCDVFVCNMWRAGGIIGDDFQCAELTPRDVYSMNVFDTNWTSSRPPQCVEADPSLPFCQLGGVYRLNLPGYNTITPYPNMGNNCPGVPPYYDRPQGC